MDRRNSDINGASEGQLRPIKTERVSSSAFLGASNALAPIGPLLEINNIIINNGANHPGGSFIDAKRCAEAESLARTLVIIALLTVQLHPLEGGGALSGEES